MQITLQKHRKNTSKNVFHWLLAIKSILYKPEMNKTFYLLLENEFEIYLNIFFAPP